jgi:anti-sigma-K factor RskA
MTHDTYDELAAGYALDALEGEDLARFRDHLREGCGRCASLLRQAEEALAGLAAHVPPEVPPAYVKQALMARLPAERAPVQTRERRPYGWLPWALATVAAAAAAAFFTAGVVASRYEARLGQIARETHALRERIQRDDAALREQLAAANRVVELLRDPTTRVVALAGQGPASAAAGRIIWNDRGGGYLFVSNLPPAPSDKTYEVWTITGGTPRPAGVFQVDASGQAGREVEKTPEGQPVDVFAVTLEPAGGVPAPTGPIVLASSR